MVAGHPDHALLQRRHRSIADLDRKIAPRHHDAVGGLEDLLEIADRLEALDLGNHERLAAGGPHQFASHVHVGSILGKGHRDKVGLEGDRGLDVVHVLGGERRGRQATPLTVDALAIGQHTADGDRAGNGGVGDPINSHDHAAIVEQQRIAGLHVVNQRLVIEPDARLVTQFASDIKGELIAFDQADLATGEFSDPDLGPLQVGEHADIPTEPGGDLAHHAHQTGVRIGRSMGEIDPHDIDTGQDHAFDRDRITGCRPEGGNDLGGAGDGHSG